MPIIYGLPASEVRRRTDVVFGGCSVEPMSPDVACTVCDWSGQAWHALAPLPSSVWVIMDLDNNLPAVGLVAGRFDEVTETFIFGHWSDVRTTEEYQAWLSAVSNPLALTAPFDDLSPGLVADLRAGRELLSSSDLYSAGFQALGKPPRFKFALDRYW